MRRCLRPLGGMLALAAMVLGARHAGAETSNPDELPSGSDPPFLKPIAVADVYYAYHERPPADREATLMTIGGHHDQVTVNMLALGVSLQHAKLLGTAIFQAGTSVDRLYPGPPSTGNGNPEVYKHIQQANVGWKFTPDVKVEAGIIPSHIGNESFLATDNWNYTHALISDLTPYFLGGARLTWRISPPLAVQALVYNGFDSAFGSNTHYKSGGARIDWKPTEWLAVWDSVHYGWQSTPSDTRFFDDLAVLLKLGTKLQFAIEAVYGRDAHAVPGGTTSSSVYGAIAWARLALGRVTYVAARVEAVIDDDGTLMGRGARPPIQNGAPTPAQTPAGQRVYAATLTLGWQPHPKLIARIEALHRVSDRPFFSGGDGSDEEHGVRSHSTTLVASAAFAY